MPERVTRRDQELLLTLRGVAPSRHHATSPAPNLDRRIAEAHWSKTKPPYSNLLIDPAGFIWVEDFRVDKPDALTQEQTNARWSVFDGDGKWLGSLELPAQFFLQSIHGRLLYGIWRDDDGVRSVRVYRLHRD